MKMKVLKDNYTKSNINETIENTKPYPRKILCEYCGSELEYEETDLRIGFLGCAHLDCPLCGRANMIEDNENTITLTKDNVEFPAHFWHTSTQTGASDCCNNEEVRKDINRAIDYFRRNKNEYTWYTCCGNRYVNVYRCDGDESYEVTVSNNYYETSIPFEEEDY
jgi:hypothetical protein